MKPVRVIFTRLCFRISIAHGLSLAIGCIIATLVTPKCAVCRGLLHWLHRWSLLILCSPNICHFVCSVLSIDMTKVKTYYSAYYMDFCLFLYDHSVFLSLCTQFLKKKKRNLAIGFIKLKKPLLVRSTLLHHHLLAAEFNPLQPHVWHPIWWIRGSEMTLS